MAARVVSRRLVKASDSSIKPHVVTFSNLDLINDVQYSMTCVYPKPPTTSEFSAVVAAFETRLPSFLNYFFPLAGRIVSNPSSSLPELHCSNQGAELVVGDIGVELRALNWRLSGESTKKMLLRYAEDVALSVQLLSFACGGFAVVWATNHLVGDGSFAMMLVRMWSELVRTGTISGGAPTHDRSLFFRPRDPPSYGRSVAGMFMRWDPERMVNALTAEESFVERLYYVEERDIAKLRAIAGADGRRATRFEAVSAYLWKVFAGVVGTSARLPGAAEKRCRLVWYVNGRNRLSPPELRDALRNYAGNVRSYVVGEAAVDTVLSRPLAGVAAMVREAITARDYDQLYQDLVDWVEVHKAAKFIETSTAGLGSPTVAQTLIPPSIPADTDFGFGQASLVMPVVPTVGRYCSSLMTISVRSGDSGGAWIINAYIWPRLAAALESDEHHVFKPLTAEYLLGTARPRL
uniref:Uncharacterized protein n=1 Tax=Avena sativa TaxID=4498 RepID=A0ACD5Y9L9_AVESA